MKHYETVEAMMGCGSRQDEQTQYRREIRFTVEALPIAQPRQRHRVIQGNGRAYATNYTPAKHPVQAFKRWIQLSARQAYQGPPITGPVEVHLVCRFPLPASARALPKRLVAMGAYVPHITKPDAENVAKACLDALTGILWRDDRQVVKLTIEKVYAKEAGADVTVTTIGMG